MQYTDEKLGLRAGVDKNGVPVGWTWEVLRRFSDENGASLGEQRIIVPITDDELRAHISEALVAQAADIAADRALRDEIVAERDALLAELQALRAPAQ